MEADDRVFMLGEDIGIYGGAFGVTRDLYHRFGAGADPRHPDLRAGHRRRRRRRRHGRMRPIVEIQFSDFTCQAMDQIVNQAAKIHFMLGGEASVPMVLRAPGGSGTGAAAQHSQSLEAWFAHVPGLKVVMPATPADAKGLLLSAIDDPNPVIVSSTNCCTAPAARCPPRRRNPLGKAAVRRRGDDITLVATGIMVSRSLEAADALAEQGVKRPSSTSAPWSRSTPRPCSMRSRTPGGCCWSRRPSSPAASCPRSPPASPSPTPSTHLLAPIGRLCGLDVPIPYAPQLERAAVPQVEDIINRSLNLVRNS